MTKDEIAGAAKADGGMFAVIPAVVMRDPALCMSARMLYGIITWKCNDDSRAWPTNRVLGAELGLSPSRVSALISQLEEHGHIETELIYDTATGEVIRRYLYPIVKSGRGTPKNSDTPPREQVDPIPENSEEKRKEKRKEDPPKAPQGGPPPEKPKKRREPRSIPEWEPERFNAFWDCYPRHEDRVGAVREWDKLRPPGALISLMAQALVRQKETESWRAGIGIPYACRWLRNRRWEDEVTPPLDTGQADGAGGRQMIEREVLPEW